MWAVALRQTVCMCNELKGIRLSAQLTIIMLADSQNLGFRYRSYDKHWGPRQGYLLLQYIPLLLYEVQLLSYQQPTQKNVGENLCSSINLSEEVTNEIIEKPRGMFTFSKAEVEMKLPHVVEVIHQRTFTLKINLLKIFTC